jgi:hypothetical protein
VRELILKMSISIDGFVSDLDGRNQWMFGADQEAKAWVRWRRSIGRREPDMPSPELAPVLTVIGRMLLVGLLIAVAVGS